jgi:dipeptidyl aminopeptidase/acylaminoacyl peptidase
MSGLPILPILRRGVVPFAASAFLLATSVLPSLAQEAASKAHVEEVLKEMAKSRGLGPVAVSPDGSMLAYVRRGKDGSELVIAPFSDASRVTVVGPAKKGDLRCGTSDPAWAGDSRRLAFLSDCQSTSGQDDVFVAAIGGDLPAKPRIEAARLTEAKGELGDLAFSPDGSKIAFLYVEGATRAAGALAAMKPWSGVIGEDGVEIQRVAVVDAGLKKPVAPAHATPAQLHVYEFDWSPDSKSLAYVAADPPGENNWWVAKLYTQSVGGDANAGAKAIYAPADDPGPMHGLQIAVPRWSPDGKAIAFIGGLMSDQGSTGGDVWLIPSTGGAVRDLTPDTGSTPAWITWGSGSLFVSELTGGNSQLVRMEVPESGAARLVGAPIYSIAGTVGDGRLDMSLSATKDDGTFVFHASSFEHPAEIFAASASGHAADFAGLKQLTHLNDGVERAWGKSESLNWKNDQFQVQGWLLFPKDYDPARKYGLIVEVHGGPAAAVTSSWGGYGGISATALSALGYFVLQPNPRGSYGQGEAFAAANRKDFGYGDLRDVLAGVDTVLAKYPAIDPKRVGLTGWSYGGFMTMFGVTQTTRFRAAVAGAGISDWKSYYGENSIDQWMTPFFGASVYQDPAVYAKSSAIDFIDKVKTPTLVVVGDRDGECPAPQSFEFWHALRDEHVPTQLVVYPNEGHGFVNPDHRTDVLVRTLDWFAKYMPAGE